MNGLRVRVKAQLGKLAIDVDFETGDGTLVIVGPNGSGKSTLLSLLLGVLPVQSGRIEVGQAVLLDTIKRVSVPIEQRRLGYVPQDYALFPHLTVGDNLKFALSCTGGRTDRKALLPLVVGTLRDLGIEDLIEREIQTLSGGEQQRVALARALCVSPRALLLDEPMAALDVHTRREVRGFLRGHLEKVKLPTLIVSHDGEDAKALGHRIAVLQSGSIVQIGTWSQLVANPASGFVEEFTSSVSR